MARLRSIFACLLATHCSCCAVPSSRPCPSQKERVKSVSLVVEHAPKTPSVSATRTMRMSDLRRGLSVTDARPLRGVKSGNARHSRGITGARSLGGRDTRDQAGLRPEPANASRQPHNIMASRRFEVSYCYIAHPMQAWFSKNYCGAKFFRR